MSHASVFARLAEIAEAEAALAAERAKLLRAVASVSPPERDEYTSLRLPPDVRTRERFARLCRDLPEARREGTVWIVSRAAWTVSRRRPQSTSTTTPTPLPVPAGASAEELARAAGLRPLLRGAQR